jgi:hypothetical protein
VRFVYFLALVLLAGTAGCDIPLGAIRRSPPAGIDASAVAASAAAPDFHLDGTKGAFSLADTVSRENALLVFYRGHW